MLLIEGVPMVTCPDCEGTYFTAATLKEIERIRKHPRKLAVKRQIPVVEFDGVA